MDRRLKVVWLCHFISEDLNRYFGTTKNIGGHWMTQFLHIMENQNVEIHVVAPNYYTNKDVEFDLNGVSYHLYHYYTGLITSTRFAYLEIALRDEKNIVKKTTTLINKIKPDLIHLFGAENITYSRGVLPYIGLIPCLVSFQGYIQLAAMRGSIMRKFAIRKRVRTEDEILARCPYVSFGEFEGLSRKYYEEHYGNGKVFEINFPFKSVNIDALKVNKEYDIVFWGRVTIDKGVEDLIKAVDILKKNNPKISCKILGGGSTEYINKLEKIIKHNKLQENVTLCGFQKTDEQLFTNASKARVYVIPTHYDALPGSIRESMSMKLPVVSYPVGDIPQLNNKKVCILLAEYQNPVDLANKIDTLLTDKRMSEEMTMNAYNEVMRSNSEDYIARQFMNCYKEILD